MKCQLLDDCDKEAPGKKKLKVKTLQRVNTRSDVNPKSIPLAKKSKHVISDRGCEVVVVADR